MNEQDESFILGEPDKLGTNIFTVNLRVKALESERDKLKQENERLQATVDRVEAAYAFQTKEVERLKSALADAVPLHEMDATAFEINRLKAELAECSAGEDQALMQRNQAFTARDAWKARAEKLANELKEIVGDDTEPLTDEGQKAKEALADYDATVRVDAKGFSEAREMAAKIAESFDKKCGGVLAGTIRAMSPTDKP